MILLAGVLNIWVGYIITTQFNLFMVYVGRAAVGYIRGVVVDSNNLFLSEKHANSGGVLYTKYLNIFRQFIASVFIFYSQI